MLAHMCIQMSMTGVIIGDGGSFREFDFYFSAKQSFSWSHSCTAVWGSSVIAQKFVQFLLPIFVFCVSRLDDFLEHWHTTLNTTIGLGLQRGHFLMFETKLSSELSKLMTVEGRAIV